MRAIMFTGETLNPHHRIGDQGVEDGDQIDLHLIQRDGGVTISGKMYRIYSPQGHP